MWYALRAINQYRHVPSMRRLYDLTDGVDCSQSIGYMGDGDDPRPRSQQAFKLLELEFAAIIDGRNPQLCSLLRAQNLPGNDVGVVLHLSDQYFVSCTDVRTAVSLRNQVDGFRSPAHKEDLACVRSID